MSISAYGLRSDKCGTSDKCGQLSIHLSPFNSTLPACQLRRVMMLMLVIRIRCLWRMMIQSNAGRQQQEQRRRRPLIDQQTGVQYMLCNKSSKFASQTICKLKQRIYHHLLPSRWLHAAFCDGFVLLAGWMASWRHCCRFQ